MVEVWVVGEGGSSSTCTTTITTTTTTTTTLTATATVTTPTTTTPTATATVSQPHRCRHPAKRTQSGEKPPLLQLPQQIITPAHTGRAVFHSHPGAGT